MRWHAVAITWCEDLLLSRSLAGQGERTYALPVSAALPLQDARLASFEQMLGFDWLAFPGFHQFEPRRQLVPHRCLPQCVSTNDAAVCSAELS